MGNLPGILTCIQEPKASLVMSNVFGTPKESTFIKTNDFRCSLEKLFQDEEKDSHFSFFPLIFLIFELESNYHSNVSPPI